MQSQVAARIQHTFVGNHDILVSCTVPFLIQRFNLNIAFPGSGGTVNSDSTVCYLQVDILLSSNRVCRGQFTYFDVALFRFYRYAAAGRSDGCLNRFIAFLRGNYNIADSTDVTGAVIFAHDNIAFLRYVELHIAAGRYIFAH